MQKAPRSHRLLAAAAISAMCLISFMNPAAAQQHPDEVKGPRQKIQVGTDVHSAAAAAMREVSWAAYQQGVALARTISAGVPLSKRMDRIDVGVGVQDEQPVVRLAYHF